MTNAPSGSASTPNAAVAKPQTAAESKQLVLKEIGAKWTKFSEQDLSALKGKDDLVAQVVAKYGLEKAQAQRDVDAMLKGRHI
jgi:pyruvate-formate lyase